MKKVDIKSLLIGVLITTNLFFFMGFSSTTETDRDPYYSNDDIMRVLKSVENDVNYIETYVSSIETDVSVIRNEFDREFNSTYGGHIRTKQMIKEIHRNR